MESFFHPIGGLNYFSLLTQVPTQYTTHISCICSPTHKYILTAYSTGLQAWQTFRIDWQAEKVFLPVKVTQMWRKDRQRTWKRPKQERSWGQRLPLFHPRRLIRRQQKKGWWKPPKQLKPRSRKEEKNKIKPHLWWQPKQLYQSLIQILFPVKTTSHYLIWGSKLKLQRAFHQ